MPVTIVAFTPIKIKFVTFVVDANVTFVSNWLRRIPTEPVMPTAYEKAVQALDAEFGKRMRNLRDALPNIEAHEALSCALNGEALNTAVLVRTHEVGCSVWIEVHGLHSSQTRLVTKLADWQWNLRESDYVSTGYYWLVRRTAGDRVRKTAGDREYTIYLPTSVDPRLILRECKEKGVAA